MTDELVDVVDTGGGMTVVLEIGGTVLDCGGGGVLEVDVVVDTGGGALVVVLRHCEYPRRSSDGLAHRPRLQCTHSH